MRILPQFAQLTACSFPPRFRLFRLLLRAVLFAFGVYAIHRAEANGKARAAYFAAKIAAHREQMRLETEAFMQRADQEMAEIYRGINTVLSYANLEPIGDGD